ncbi:RodZ domain-containing protein [Nocardiopsis sp. LOL_012]|uniref:RodZ domain-containing protein n=1 Tax=Nocardiopsis sp. LOL_012 TaxID=3345409 RepID=UPI003A8AC9F2
MATIGQTLAAARAASGLTVADLSTRTRIRVPVLLGIEAEDFHPCGGDFYARGHIRGICRALGLDPAPFLEEFDREHAGRDRPAFAPVHRRSQTPPENAGADREQVHVVPRGTPEEGGGTDPAGGSERWGHFERRQHLPGSVRGRAPRRGAVPAPRTSPEGPSGRRPRERRPAPRPAVSTTRRSDRVRRIWPWAVVGIILALAVLVGVRAWNDWERGQELRSAFEAGLGSSEALSLDGGPTPAAPREGAVAEGTAAGDTETAIGLTATERSWLQVSRSDGTPLYTGFLLAGDTRTFTTRDTLELWVGNANTLDLSVDGRDMGPLSAEREVTTVTVGADGVLD